MFWQNFTRLCNERGESPNVVAANIGLKSTGTVTGWKNGAIPRSPVLYKLANYFGVSVDDLLKDNVPAEVEMDDFTYAMHGFSGDLTEENKQALRQMAQQLADANRKKNANGTSK